MALSGTRMPMVLRLLWMRRGTSEVAVLSVGGIVVSRSLRVAGDELDQDIMQYMRNKYNLLIGERIAEQVKMAVGSAYHLPEEKTIAVRGRNLITGLPESIEVSSVEIREAIAASINTIIDTVKDFLAKEHTFDPRIIRKNA